MKRLICLLLSIAMVWSLLPVSALAEGEEAHDEACACEEEHVHEEEKPAPKEEKKEEKKAEPEPEPVKEEKAEEPVEKKQEEEKTAEPAPAEEKTQEEQPEQTEPTNEKEPEPIEEEPTEEPAEEDHSEPATEKAEPLYPWSELDDDDLIAYIYAAKNEKYLKELLLHVESDEYAAFLARIEDMDDKDAREEVSAYLLTLVPTEAIVSEEATEVEPMIPDFDETGEKSASNETDESTDEEKDESNLTEEPALNEGPAEVPEPDVEEIAEVILPGDVNGDSRVNGLDLLWLTRYAAGAAAEIKPENADVNVDGIVDDIDIERLTKILTGAV